MPIDPIAPAATPVQAKPVQTKTGQPLNDPAFSALLQQDLKAGLKPGPKLSETPKDGFKAAKAPDHFMPLNRNLGTATPPLTASSVEALGATAKHPLGPQKP